MLGIAMAKSDATPTFGSAFLRARAVLRIGRGDVAHACRVTMRTVARWEADESWPTLEDRHLLLRLYSKLPREDLHSMAALAQTTLAAAGIPETPVAAPPSPGPLPPAPFSAAAQKVVDDAIREAAEDLGLVARDLRPVASRLFDARARAGVTPEAAARMVLGIPKRPEKTEQPEPRAPKEPEAR